MPEMKTVRRIKVPFFFWEQDTLWYNHNAAFSGFSSVIFEETCNSSVGFKK